MEERGKELNERQEKRAFPGWWDLGEIWKSFFNIFQNMLQLKNTKTWELLKLGVKGVGRRKFRSPWPVSLSQRNKVYHKLILCTIGYPFTIFILEYSQKNRQLCLILMTSDTISILCYSLNGKIIFFVPYQGH